MDIKSKVNEIKGQLSAEQIQDKICNDRQLTLLPGKKYVCFMHNDTVKRPNLSYNSNGKYFKCFSCGKTYDIFDHYMQFYHMSFIEALQAIVTDFKLSVDLELENGNKHRPTANYDKVIEHSDINDICKAYANSRHISDRSIDYVGLKSDKNNIVFEYRDEAGNHVTNKYRPARKIKNKGDIKMWFQSNTSQATLFNMDKVDVTKPVIICEGEFDCLSLIESGFYNAVSVSNGANALVWIDNNWDWLKQIDEIWLWFDNDDPGIKGAREVANRLDNCTKMIFCDEGCKDINELLYKKGQEAVLEQIEKAKEIEISNIITTDMIEDFNIYEAEKITSGVKEVDENIIGFIMGSLDVITGYNGSGKSTIINQLCIAESISQGYKVFVFSGELIPAHFKNWLFNTMVDEDDLFEAVSMKGNKYYRVKRTAIDRMDRYLKNKLYLYDSMDYSQEAILGKMHTLAKRKGVKVFVIDNLMKITLTDMMANELVAQKNFIQELKKFAVQYNAVVHLVAHPRKPQAASKITKFDISGTADITNLADYVLAMTRYEAEDKKKSNYDGALSIFKDRPNGSPLKHCALYFDKKRRRFYLDKEELKKSYVVNDDQQELWESATDIPDEWR